MNSFPTWQHLAGSGPGAAPPGRAAWRIFLGNPASRRARPLARGLHRDAPGSRLDRARHSHGFTLVEVAVVLGIIAVIAALAFGSLVRARPRATMADASSEIVGILYNARQNALATGNHTIVMFFPQQANRSGGTGRVVAYEDPTFRFFTSAAAVNFGNWDASRDTSLAGTTLLGGIDLPRGIAFGLGGATPPTLPAPYDTVTASACNFCSGSGDGRGAVVFDSRGSARFYSATGAPLALRAGTVAITGSPTVPGYLMLLVTPTTGAVRPHAGG